MMENYVANCRLRIAEHCIRGAAEANPELLSKPQFRFAILAVLSLMEHPDEPNYDVDAYALARKPKAPLINPAWQNREKVK